MKIGRLVAGLAALLLTAHPARSLTVGFEDLPHQFTSFSLLGITSTYQGFTWTGSSGEWGLMDNGNATANQFVTTPMGSNYAWSYSAPQSLFINFHGAYDVTSISATKFFVGASRLQDNTSSLSFYGYNAAGALIASTSATALTASWQTLNINFQGVDRLEIRGNSQGYWFAVDDLVLNQSVPEPSLHDLIQRL